MLGPKRLGAGPPGRSVRTGQDPEQPARWPRKGQGSPQTAGQRGRCRLRRLRWPCSMCEVDRPCHQPVGGGPGGRGPAANAPRAGTGEGVALQLHPTGRGTLPAPCSLPHPVAATAARPALSTAQGAEYAVDIITIGTVSGRSYNSFTGPRTRGSRGKQDWMISVSLAFTAHRCFLGVGTLDPAGCVAAG